MSAFAEEDYAKTAKPNRGRLEFGHAALGCMGVSLCGLSLYYTRVITAQTELQLELATLALKTYFEVHYRKWGPDILVHHVIMVFAFLLIQLPTFEQFAALCVAMQLVHVPLFFKYCWLVAERDVFFKSLPAGKTRRFLHSAFWPSWLAVVFFRSPFMLCTAAASLPSLGGWVVLCFSAAIMYLDTLWTFEVAVSKSHGVLGPAVSEPKGWPEGLTAVKPWAVAPCFLGLSAAVLPWGAHFR